MRARKKDNLMEDVVAWQSSTTEEHEAEKAVDKNNKSCAKTDSAPYFLISMYSHVIRKIKIWTSHENENHTHEK